jgi:transcriptional regulator with XRE-family HTH domain
MHPDRTPETEIVFRKPAAKSVVGKTLEDYEFRKEMGGQRVRKRCSMNFMENLRVLREKNNMTQEQLAERMEVSRQTVSKWESGTSMPEMEKLVQLTEMFGCTMDGLLKGNMHLENEKESELYDRYGNWVARRGALATCICILAFAAQQIGEYISPSFLGESGLPFMLGALLGTLLWIRIGMLSSHFHEKHPYVEPFYTEEEKEEFHRKYMTWMIAGIGILIAALIVTASLYAAWDNVDDRMDAIFGGLFLGMVSIGVGIIVYIALMASKYNVEGYNEDNAWEASEEGKENRRRIKKVCCIIMLMAVICTILLWLWETPHVTAGIPLAIGGILCGAASVALNKRR